jgi:hypothetical protein
VTLDFAWEILTNSKLRFGDALQVEAHRTLLNFMEATNCTRAELVEVIQREMRRNNPEGSPMLIQRDDGTYELNILK